MSIHPKPHPALAFRLTNGKAGVEYRCKLELIDQNVPDYEIKAIEVPPQIGLIGEGSLKEVYGTPTKDGEFKVKVWYSIGDSDLAQSVSVALVINPDPKSLWKDLPSNQSDPYGKPDLASVSLAGDAVHMVAASKRGRSHAHVGSFRDDDFYLSYLPEDRWHIAIVSDGAGSAKFSRRGSQIICNEGGARLQELLVGADGAKLIQAVESLNAAKVNGSPSEGLERQVQNLLYTTIGYTAHHVTKLLQDECKTRADLGGVFKDYSSTAIIGLMRKFPFGVLCATYWVGDGAVGVLKTDGTATLLGESDSGEYSGQTRFLEPAEVSQDALMKRIRFELTAEFKAMILMTDGVSDPFFETEANLTNPAKWTALWEDVSSKASLDQADQEVAQRVVDWLDFWSSGNHDDRTLAVLY
jgi:serine/threonine protein phosphatase PrpC